MLAEDLIPQLDRLIEELEEEIWQLNLFLFENPELGGEEFKAAEKITALLTNYGFEVEKEVAGMPTAFKARFRLGERGGKIAFLAEYDALPEIGHACGHDLIATASVYAGILASRLLEEAQGEILVMGTPAEETFGGKVKLLEQGAFDDVDLALLIHPSHKSWFNYRSLAAQVLTLEFHGRPAHAAASPWKGINALDALLQTFMAIDNLKKQLSPGVRVPGIITHGGERPNIVPEYATGVFSIRALTVEELREVMEKVLLCAEGASIATGARLNYSFDDPLLEMWTNLEFVRIFTHYWEKLGGESPALESSGFGSTDVANVSHSLPCIQPEIKVTDEPFSIHTPEFAQATTGDTARAALLRSIKTLTLTACEVLLDDALFQRIYQEFRKRHSSSA